MSSDLSPGAVVSCPPGLGATVGVGVVKKQGLTWTLLLSFCWFCIGKLSNTEPYIPH